ncbi:hypothetical protein OKA05_28625 [Luteolibacter arcticus]|uniref:Autotransporter outer membrane beta-barrel domain-containing protein n=1 Tax=Luteolibacter arcticus TaxID=1581411 RepID=A0ABT3GSQ6_9BACT|nr:hypothetical protein [Luteolibacter arcticus]MCW1926551.1 hypothetical protein [Luteolibacter arcticus]
MSMNMSVNRALSCMVGLACAVIPSGSRAAEDNAATKKLREAEARVTKAENELKAAKEEYDRLSKVGTEEDPDDKPTMGEPEKDEKAITRISQYLTEEKKVKFQVRQSVRDSLKTANPATFSFTRTKDGKDVRSADLGVSFEQDICETDFAWGLLGEYHHLTKSRTKTDDRGVDSLFLGGSLDWNAFFIGEETQRIRGTLAYKRDKIYTGEGLITDVSLYPALPQYCIGNEFTLIPRVVTAVVEPVFGLQYEEGNGAKGFRDGDRISAKASLNLGLILLPEHLGNRLTLDNKLTFWEHFDTSGDYGRYDEQQWFLNSTLTYWFDTRSSKNKTDILQPDEQHIGLSAGLKWGDNPEEGQQDTDTMTLGISVKY